MKIKCTVPNSDVEAESSFKRAKCISTDTIPCSHVADDCLAPLNLRQNDTLLPFSTWLHQHWTSFECTQIKFSLQRHLSAWQDIRAHPFILGIVASGYRIPFINPPTPCQRPNNPSATTHADFVLQSIGDFLHNGWARLVSTPPTCINPLQVSIQSNGKKRLILDLTHVNRFLYKQPFKMEGLTSCPLHRPWPRHYIYLSS